MTITFPYTLGKTTGILHVYYFKDTACRRHRTVELYLLGLYLIFFGVGGLFLTCVLCSMVTGSCSKCYGLEIGEPYR